MNAPRSLPWLLCALIALCCLPLFAVTAWAGDGSVEISTSMLQANVFLELVSNRARLVQVTCVIVALGCALIWWCK